MDSRIMKKPAKHLLSLFVAGITPKSSLAITTVTRVCRDHLDGACEVEVIDVYQQPSVARQHNVVAAPMLLRRSPLPARRFVGRDLSNACRLLESLGIGSDVSECKGF